MKKLESLGYVASQRCHDGVCGSYYHSTFNSKDWVGLDMIISVLFLLIGNLRTMQISFAFSVMECLPSSCELTLIQSYSLGGLRSSVVIELHSIRSTSRSSINWPCSFSSDRECPQPPTVTPGPLTYTQSTPLTEDTGGFFSMAEGSDNERPLATTCHGVIMPGKDDNGKFECNTASHCQHNTIPATQFSKLP